MFSKMFSKVWKEISEVVLSYSHDVKLVKWRVWNANNWIYVRLVFVFTNEKGYDVTKVVVFRGTSRKLELVTDFDPRKQKGEHEG